VEFVERYGPWTVIAGASEGPVCNWGQGDDVVGYAPSSAATRRARVLMTDKMSRHVFGDD
jgi:hypothetical protein